MYTLSFKCSFYFIMLIGLHVYYLLLWLKFQVFVTKSVTWEQNIRNDDHPSSLSPSPRTLTSKFWMFPGWRMSCNRCFAFFPPNGTEKKTLKHTQTLTLQAKIFQLKNNKLTRDKRTILKQSTDLSISLLLKKS